MTEEQKREMIMGPRKEAEARKKAKLEKEAK